VTDSKKKNHDENLFQIMDGIISQLNKTKKMFIIMILTLLILPPISFVITFALLGPPMFLVVERILKDLDGDLDGDLVLQELCPF